MTDVKLSEAMRNFFEVEVRNESEGGESPATLRSAYDSLQQAPDDIIVEWCNDPTIQNSGHVLFFCDDVYQLMMDLGEETTLASLLD